MSGTYESAMGAKFAVDLCVARRGMRQRRAVGASVSDGCDVPSGAGVPYGRFIRTARRRVMLLGTCWNMANISSPWGLAVVATSGVSTTGAGRNTVEPASRSPLLRRCRSPTAPDPTGL